MARLPQPALGLPVAGTESLAAGVSLGRFAVGVELTLVGVVESSAS